MLQLQQTPLHLSSMCGHVDIVNVLLSHGADIHVKGMVSNVLRNVVYFYVRFPWKLYILHIFNYGDILQHKVT